MKKYYPKKGGDFFKNLKGLGLAAPLRTRKIALLLNKTVHRLIYDHKKWAEMVLESIISKPP